MKKFFTLIVMLTAVLGIRAEETANYCLCAKTTAAHANVWDDQVNYALTSSMKKGNSYKLSMKVKASANCNLAFWPIWTTSPNRNQWNNSDDVQYLDSKAIKTEWATYTWNFTANFDLDRLDFVFGGLNGNLYIDDVKLVDTEVGVNMVQNGDFAENNLGNWSTVTGYQGTTISIVDSDSGSAAPAPGEPVIPDTWEFAKQGNPNFHVYLAFGQSNMEGNAAVEAQDKVDVPERFKMMAAVNFNSPSRKMGEWYTAVPPLCRQGTGLTPCDYFGRYLVENLPEEIEVGVINVAVGGARIELFMQEFKDEYIAGEAGWFQGYCAQYNNDPLGRLIEMGKKAQEKGVIKGILLHQGESNNGASDWAEKVGKVYKRICYALGLNPAEVPLLAGETLYQNMGGGCYWHNTAALPKLKAEIPNSYVISAKDIPGNGQDAWHFSAAGYRELGKRYGQQMLEILKNQPSGMDNDVFVAPWQVGKRYDLSGREVDASYKGIVIENGKKVVR